MRYRYSSSNDSSAKLVANLIGLGLILVFYLWFYAVSYDGVGKIASKWTETHTSCSDGDCTTSTSYLVQFDDSSIYGVFWGTRDWDPMIVNTTIKYHARGRNFRLFGWRVMNPDIFSWERIDNK